MRALPIFKYVGEKTDYNTGKFRRKEKPEREKKGRKKRTGKATHYRSLLYLVSFA